MAVHITIRRIFGIGGIEVCGSRNVIAGKRIIDSLLDRIAISISRSAPPVASLVVAAIGRIIDAAIVWSVTIRSTIGIDHESGFVDKSVRFAFDLVYRYAGDRIDLV